jgi:hypothetical protein
MDYNRVMIVPVTHTLSSVSIVLYITCPWTLCHTRIVVLGFALVIVQAALQSQCITVYKLSLVRPGSPSWSSSIHYHFPFPFLSLPSLLCLIIWSLPFLHLFF